MASEPPVARGPSLTDAQRAKAVYDAELKRLELEERKGTLVNAAEVTSKTFSLARQLRDSLLVLADRLAPVLAAVDDAAECHRLLREEHAVALRSLADG